MATNNAANYNLAGMTSSGIVKCNGTTLVTSTTALIDGSNIATNTSQPAFFAYASSIQTDVTGDGTLYQVLFDSELFDNSNNFASSTFTAPVTGRYHFNIAVLCQQAVATESAIGQLVTTAHTYTAWNIGAAVVGNNQVIFSLLVPMSATDTAVVKINFTGGTKVVDVFGDASSFRTSFSGQLVC